METSIPDLLPQILDHDPETVLLFVGLQDDDDEEDLDWEKVICVGAGQDVAVDVGPEFIEDLLVFSAKASAEALQGLGVSLEQVGCGCEVCCHGGSPFW